MPSKNRIQQLLELNLAIFFIGTSGALGRYVSLPPPITIWWRCFVALLFLLLYCWWKKVDLKFDPAKDGGLILLSGLLMMGHWVFYFYSLQLSNVAIGMLSLFTYPVWTALLEPLVLRSPFQLTHLGMGLLILVGIFFLAPDFDLQNSHTQAVGFGILSALCYSFRNLMMKKKVTQFSGSMLMVYQVLTVVVLLWPLFFFLDGSAIQLEWPAILALGLFTTAIGHTLFVQSFKNFSITQASIISSSMPIYGILTGLIFLGEIPSWNSIIGGALIIATVIWESLRMQKSQ